MYYERSFNNVACDIIVINNVACDIVINRVARDIVIDHVACESVSCCVIDV